MGDDLKPAPYTPALQRVVLKRLADRIGVQSIKHVPGKRKTRAVPLPIDELRVRLVAHCLGPDQGDLSKQLGLKTLRQVDAYLSHCVDTATGKNGPTLQAAQITYRNASEWFYDAKARYTKYENASTKKRLAVLAECMADMSKAMELMRLCADCLDWYQRDPEAANADAAEALHRYRLEQRLTDEELNRATLPDELKELA